LAITFKLENGVKLHDGSPLTSADAKVTYERISIGEGHCFSCRESSSALSGVLEGT
jgi:ABC-type transport system substrate-binding protein